MSDEQSIKQSVNLYSAELQPKKEQFNAQTTLITGGIFCAILALLSGFLWFQNNNFEQHVLETERKTALILQRVAKANTMAQTNRQRSENLDQQIAILRNERDEKRQLLSMIDEYVAGANNKPFSSYIVALGRQTLPGIWLNSIEIDNSNQQFHITGRSASANLVPRLIQKLADEPTLSGLTFAKAEIQRDEESGQIHFSLSSSLEK